MRWKRGLVLVFFFCLAGAVFAQETPDSLIPKPVQKDTVRRRPPVRKRILPKRDSLSLTIDSTGLRKDSTNRPAIVFEPPAVMLVKPSHELDSIIYTKHPFYRFTNPVRFTTSLRNWVGKEGIFYALVGLLIFFAIIRNAFPKYLNDLFRLYFRATLKQRQIREQLMQAPVPSLLLNILFFISGGLLVSLLFTHYKWMQGIDFWTLLFYAITALLIVYLVKFLVLKICGWIFRLMEAADAYIFIVFTNNKILGILLLPLILFLAFTDGITYEIIFALTISVVIGLFAYRYFLAFGTVQRQVKINFFHFLIYMLAFEVAPVLLINKLLLKYIIERS